MSKYRVIQLNDFYGTKNDNYLLPYFKITKNGISYLNQLSRDRWVKGKLSKDEMSYFYILDTIGEFKTVHKNTFSDEHTDHLLEQGYIEEIIDIADLSKIINEQKDLELNE